MISVLGNILPATARDLLSKNSWNVEQAINAYLMSPPQPVALPSGSGAAPVSEEDQLKHAISMSIND